MIDVFTIKRISPDCPFKSNQRLPKISILTPRCAVWLRGVMHTAESDSAEWCTPRSLTPRCDAQRGVFWGSCYPWLRGMMHTTELDSAVGCTPQTFLRTLHHLTLRCDAHRGAWLRGGMHTAELDSPVCSTPWSFLKISNISVKLKQNSKIL